MNRLVLDTNVVVSGLFWHGSPRTLLELGRAGTVSFFASAKLIEELINTLSKDKFSPKVIAGGRPVEALAFGYSMLSEVIACEPLPNPIAPDPDDDWVIATALAARADLIVTGDKPLLSVGEVDGIRIVTVAEALDLLEAE